MAIISGGLKGVRSNRQPTNPVRIKSPDSQIKKVEEPEGWGGYAARNISQLPTRLWEKSRSLGGVGDLANLGLRKIGAPSAIQTLQRIVIPTHEQARQEAAAVLPEYMTESRPEDYWAQEALAQAPLIAATGGFSSLPAFAKSALTSAGAIAGSELGGEFGGELGGALGDREIGQLVGSIGGGHVGAGLANIRRPSKAIEPKVQAKERVAYERRRAKNLARETKKYNKIALELPKEKRAFESTKKDLIKTNKKQIADYKNTIKSVDKSRVDYYNNAERLTGSAKAIPTDLGAIIFDVKSNLNKGLSANDKKAISHNIEQLSDKIIGPKDSLKPLTLKDAKTFQKNFNDQIYNKDASNSFKREMSKVRDGLNKFISETGSEEHNANWNKGEQATRDMYELKKNEKEFIHKKVDDIRDIEKQKFPYEKEAAHRLQKAEAKKLVDALGKETYEDFMRSKSSQEGLSAAIDKAVGSNAVSHYGLAGLGSIIGYFGFGGKGAALGTLIGQIARTGYKEYNIAKNAYKNHPEIFKEAADLVVNAGKMSTPRVIAALNQLGENIENTKNKKEDKRKGGIISGGMKFQRS